MSFEDYMQLPYTIVLKKGEDGDYIAKIKELKGCVAHGDTASKALESIEGMKALWIESCIEDGEDVPLPDEEPTLPSGKWLQRAPRSLHAALARLAEEDSVSLNQFVVAVLSKEVGARSAPNSHVSSIHGVASAITDHWAKMDFHGQWNVIDVLPAGVPDLSFMSRWATATTQQAKLVTIGMVGHGKDKEDEHWN